jgi:hypothetical protein
MHTYGTGMTGPGSGTRKSFAKQTREVAGRGQTYTYQIEKQDNDDIKAADLDLKICIPDP